MCKGSAPWKRFLPLMLMAAACGSSSSAPGTPSTPGTPSSSPGTSSLSLTVSPASLIIQPGAIATATVTAVRAPSDEGPIEIAIQGAPDGVSVDAPAIPAGANAAQITLRNQCTGDPLNGAPVTVRGTVGGR